MTVDERIRQLIGEPEKLPAPIREYAFVDPGTLPFSAEVRAACERNLCGCYGRYWTCPPAVGDWRELAEHYRGYRCSFVYTTVHPLEDSFDIEGMEEGRRLHARLDDYLFAALNETGRGAFELLGAEGCGRCPTCSYPTAPCRHPETLRVPMEATGMDVVTLAANNQIHYWNGANTVTYFSLIVYTA